MTDYEAAYRGVRVRVTELLADRSHAVLEQMVPATPEWRVRDVAAHLGGVCDDLAHGNLSGVATEPWTRAQVEKRRGWAFERVLADWAEHAGTVEPNLNEIGQPIGQMVFDAWTHEQDVRAVLGVPGGRDSAAFDVAFDWFLATSRDLGASRSEPRGSLHLVNDEGTFVLGEGAPVGTVRAPRFELMRVLTGRRSREQIRALDWDGPPLEDLLFDNDLFTPAAHDILE